MGAPAGASVEVEIGDLQDVLAGGAVLGVSENSLPNRPSGRTREDVTVKLFQALPCAFAALMFTACTPPTPSHDASAPAPIATTAQADPAPAPAPMPPKHAWTFHQRGVYGYQLALSANDKAAGIAAQPLTLITYGGKTGSKYAFTQRVEAGSVRMMSCTEPCDNMIVETYGGGTIDQQVLPITDGTVLAAMLADAKAGMLQPYAETR